MTDETDNKPETLPELNDAVMPEEQNQEPEQNQELEQNAQQPQEEVVVEQADAERSTQSPENSIQTTPKKDISQMNRFEIEEQLKGHLSVHEREELENALKEPKTVDISKYRGPNTKPDVDKENFKEQDVIDYMFQHWLVDGFLESDKWVREKIIYGYYKLQQALQNQARDRKLNQTSITGSETFKSAKKVDEILDKKIKTIEEERTAKDKQITDIGNAINSGTLFDKGNEELLKAYKEMIKYNTPEGKDQYLQTQKLSSNKKVSPNNSEVETECKKAAVDFASEARINLRFDSLSKTAAAYKTAADINNALANNPHSHKNVESSFAQIEKANLDDIYKGTIKQRDKALASGERNYTALKLCKKNAAYTSLINKILYRSDLGNLNNLIDYAKSAYNHSAENIADGKCHELGQKAPENEKLSLCDALIKNNKQGFTQYQTELKEKSDILIRQAIDNVKKSGYVAKDLYGQAMEDKKIEEMIYGRQKNLSDRDAILTAKSVEAAERRSKAYEKYPELFNKLHNRKQKQQEQQNVEKPNNINPASRRDEGR